jgi:transcriptional regulator with XRE-family HTH domain
MADRCGVFINTYFNWEQAPEKLTIEKTHIIADALGVPYNDIIFTSDDTKCSIGV